MDDRRRLSVGPQEMNFVQLGMLVGDGRGRSNFQDMHFSRSSRPPPSSFFFLIPPLQVFVDSKPYSVKPLEELLLQEFGADTKLFDIREPK